MEQQGSPGIAKALQKTSGAFEPFLCHAAVQLHPALPHMNVTLESKLTGNAAAIHPQGLSSCVGFPS